MPYRVGKVQPSRLFCRYLFFRPAIKDFSWATSASYSLAGWAYLGEAKEVRPGAEIGTLFSMGTVMKRIGRFQDVLLAAGVVMIVAMLIIPMPPQLLDILIAFNITFSLTLLLACMYVSKALDLAAFPSLLLLTTMLRLGINVSVTRLILLDGSAGSVVESFGNFVVGGNLIVGMVIFLILVVIQFVVVTNGAGRVAEVAARFTLDAMPGKQIAIDADLNAGQINEDQARERRKEITREADFYGSMDGASKFVKGDAIAGLIIVAINLIGGITVGVLQQGLSFSEATQTFSLLTIGDGLAAQIPALLIAVATGILVTRSDSETDLGSEISSQLSAYPRALQVAGSAALLFAIVPGMPHIPFAVLGLALFFTGRLVAKRAAEMESRPEPIAVAEPESEAETTRAAITVDPLELAVGVGLIPMVDPSSGGSLTQRISAVRRQIASELGMVIALLRVHDDPMLDAHDYVIRVRGAEAARYHLVPGHMLAIQSGPVMAPLQGLATTDPAFGLPAVWIPDAQRAEAEALGYNVVDAETVIITHLTETIRRHVAQLLTRQETKKMLDALKEDNEAAVDEVVPDTLTVGEVQRVLQALLSEGVSIRDLGTILEAIGDRARQGVRETAALAEYARQSLGRALTQPFLDEARVLHVLTLGPELETQLAESLTETADGLQLALDPLSAQSLVREILEKLTEAQAKDINRPVLLCSERLRRHLHALLVQAAPSLPVIAYQEVSPGLRVETVAQISGAAATA
jgi:flagellar biosynthesis protein FlhA